MDLQSKEQSYFFEHSDADAPVVVALHGGPGLGCQYFMPLFYELSKSVSIFSYDQGTQGDKDIEHFNDLIQELQTIIDRLNGRKLALLGHSFGSIIALAHASKSRNSKLPLVLMSWIFDSNWIKTFESRTTNYQDIEERIRSQQFESLEESFKQNMIAYADYYFANPETRKSGIGLFQNMNYYPKIAEKVGSTWEEEVNGPQILRSIKNPILSICGSKDRVVYPDYTRSAESYAKHCKFIELSSAGHFPFVEEPRVVSQSIVSFLEEEFRNENRK